MGHAIGYLRKPDRTEHPPLPSDPKTHQYQSISDDENDFGSPLDLGPSLMDEVFSELSNYDTLKLNKEDRKEDVEDHHGIGHNIVDTCNKLADRVTTLTLSRKHKGKKAAFVKPIKASDEKTLENAIKMANQLASKSMQDLDKRSTDDMFNASPQISPITPNSPTKKFSFKFPTNRNRSTSPKGARNFSDDVASNTNIEAMISNTARDAYKALIEGKDQMEKPEAASPVMKYPTLPTSSSQASHRLSLPPSSSVFTFNKPTTLPSLSSDVDISETESSNPLPLPPKEGKSHVTTGKRHVRKNPLILTSGAAASMARRFETEEPSSAQSTCNNPQRNKNTQLTTNE